MELSTWIRAKRGRFAQLARAVGVAQSWLWQMAHRGAKVPKATALAIEQATGGEVSRRETRPRDWMRLWPDMASQATQHPPQQAAATQQQAINPPTPMKLDDTQGCTGAEGPGPYGVQPICADCWRRGRPMPHIEPAFDGVYCKERRAPDHGPEHAAETARYVPCKVGGAHGLGCI
jgi:DNA-binding transcriptional regulator YdaS (Cro superfamily)